MQAAFGLRLGSEFQFAVDVMEPTRASVVRVGTIVLDVAKLDTLLVSVLTKLWGILVANVVVGPNRVNWCKLGFMQ